jgi:hypothetical protein
VAWDEDSDDDEEDEDEDGDGDEESEDDDEEDEDEESDDEGSDDESASIAPTPKQPSIKSATNMAASKETLKPTPEDRPTPTPNDNLKPTQPRRSNDEKSVADSDASYDLVSGTTSRAPSRAPGSPQQDKRNE